MIVLHNIPFRKVPVCCQDCMALDWEKEAWTSVGNASCALGVWMPVTKQTCKRRQPRQSATAANEET
jgi:hypothetical protein